MNWEFAYSAEMQIILSFFAFTLNFLNMYLIANLILAMYGEKADEKQKFIFAFLTGVLMLSVFVYAVCFIGGAVSFSKEVYLLVVSPNPFFALMYFFIGIKFLKLSPIRSIRIMSHIYLFLMLVMNINRFIASVFFVQCPERYNYLIDALQQITNFAVFLAAYFIMNYILKKSKFCIRLADKMFINLKKELVLYFLITSFIYGITVILPLLIAEPIIANFTIVLILVLLFISKVLLDICTSAKMDITNRDVHINTLLKGISEFTSIKHDFYNILQSYEGYLQLGDVEKLKRYHHSLLHTTTSAGASLELSQRMTENPVLISLLMSKAEYAEKMDVEMRIVLQSSLKNLYMDDIDICRCLACLLDNAIEAASGSEKKEVFFTIETKVNGQKLIIITNSTASSVNVDFITTTGVTSKQGHQGIGISNVRKTIGKYGNCTFEISYYDFQFSAYIEIREK